MVFPDTVEGRADAKMRDPLDEVGKAYCRDYKPGACDSRVGGRVRNVCANRSCEGMRHYNWCFVCPAGFLVLSGEDTFALWGEKGTDRPSPLSVAL
jgi:hypothetical protein